VRKWSTQAALEGVERIKPALKRVGDACSFSGSYGCSRRGNEASTHAALDGVKNAAEC